MVDHPLSKFINRWDAFGQQQDDGSYSRQDYLTAGKLDSHLKGEATIGAYQLDSGSRVVWGCLDFDDAENPQRAVEQAFVHAEEMRRQCDAPVLVESSGFKGAHTWVLCKPVDALSMQLFLDDCCAGIKCGRKHERFPKQAQLFPYEPYGNLVKLPLGIHRVTGKRSAFYDLDSRRELSLDESLKLLAELEPGYVPRYRIKVQEKIVFRDKENELNPHVFDPELEQLFLSGAGLGERHFSRYKLAVYWLDKGYEKEKVRKMLYDFNSRCKPPDREPDIDAALDYLIRKRELGDSRYFRFQAKHAPVVMKW